MASLRKVRKQAERSRKRNHQRATWRAKKIKEENREFKKQRIMREVKEVLGFTRFKIKGEQE